VLAKKKKQTFGPGGEIVVAEENLRSAIARGAQSAWLLSSHRRAFVIHPARGGGLTSAA
jgi:hypothetical protein